MTIWLDEMAVRENFVDFIEADGSIERIDTTGHRVTFVVQYTEDVTLDMMDYNRIQRFLQSISDGDPELKFSASDERLTIKISAKRSVYREESEI